MAANGEIPMAAVIKPARAVRRHRTWARGRLPGRSRRAAVPRAARASDRPRYDGLECHRHREQPCPRPPTRTHRPAAVRTKPRSPDADYTRMALGRMVQAADPRFLCLAVSETHPGTQTSYAQPTGQCSSACDLPVIHRGTRLPLAHPRPGVSTQFPWGDLRSIGATCG